MSDTTAPRYGFDPKVPFAATLAGSEQRRARDAAAAAALDRRARPAGHLIRRLAARLSWSRS